MSGSSNGAGIGIFVVNRYDTIEYNTVINSGYNGIHWADNGSGRGNYVYRNRVDSFCLNKDDGGGIYSYQPDAYGSLVEENIVSNGIGTGCNYAPCIYMDANTDSTTFIGNTLWKGAWAVVFMSTPHSINFIDNTVVEARPGPTFPGAALTFPAAGGIYRNQMKRNIFYIPDSTNYIFDWVYPYIGVNYPQYNWISISDSNWLLRPMKETLKFYQRAQHTAVSLADWITYTSGYETNSHESPGGITSAVGVLHINPTEADSTITFSGLYIDAKGYQHNNSMVLHPFQSALLFKSATEIMPSNNVLRRTFKLIQQ